MTEFQGDHIIDYSYDDRGRKSERILWADGQYDVSTTTYTYDVLSRLTAVSNSSMPLAMAVAITVDAPIYVLSYFQNSAKLSLFCVMMRRKSVGRITLRFLLSTTRSDESL